MTAQKEVLDQFEKVHAECAENAENIGLTLSELSGLSGLSVKFAYYSKRK